MKKLYIIILFITICFITGCAGNHITVGNINQEFNITEVDFSKGEIFESSAKSFQFYLIIPICMNSRYQRAYQRILNKADGNYITDVSIQESWYYTCVGTIYVTRIQATICPRIERMKNIDSNSSLIL